MRRDDDFRRVMEIILSFGHDYKFFSEVIERRISYSDFFIAIENKIDVPILYSNTNKILSSFYYELDTSKWSYKIYNQCSWLSELYLKIQRKTGLTFEAIFLYLPINDGLNMFPIYHEMDFQHSIDSFNERYQKHSILFNVMKKSRISIGELANESGLSYSMISSLRTRQKNIGRVAAENLFKIAKCLNVRIETLLCDSTFTEN